MDLNLLWAIQLAPLAAFLLIQLLPKGLKKSAPILGIGFALAAATAALKLLWLHSDGAGLPQEFAHRWLHVSDRPLWPFADVLSYDLFVGFLMDRLNLLMITVVTSITFFVQLFSFVYHVSDL